MDKTEFNEEAHRLVDNLPEDATRDDLMYKVYVRQAVEVGLADSEAVRTLDVKEVRAGFGLLSRELSEDEEDLSAFEQRAAEKSVSFEKVLKDLKARGKMSN